MREIDKLANLEKEKLSIQYKELLDDFLYDITDEYKNSCSISFKDMLPITLNGGTYNVLYTFYFKIDQLDDIISKLDDVIIRLKDAHGISYSINKLGYYNKNLESILVFPTNCKDLIYPHDLSCIKKQITKQDSIIGEDGSGNTFCFEILF